MVDVGIYCKYANIAARAGANCSATSNVNTWTDGIVLDCENLINVMTRFNWNDVYASLNADVKYVLMDAAACVAAIYVINYDLSGFSSIQEATTRMDVLWACFNRDIKVLEDVKARDFINGA